MIREVELALYLPPYMKEYRELTAALYAEDPEFQLIWEACDKVFRNRFIATADSDGISSFEKMMGIHPNEGDSDEVRRMRIWAKWNNALPYTVRTLKAKIAQITGENGFVWDTSTLSEYLIDMMLLNQTDETCLLVKEILEEWIPSNMVIDLKSKAYRRGNIRLYAGTAAVQTERYVARPMAMNQYTKRTAQVSPYASMFAYQKLTARPRKEA